MRATLSEPVNKSDADHRRTARGRSRLLVAPALVLALTVLAGCGNKGDLYLRDPVAPPPMTDYELAEAKAQAQAEAAQSGPDDERPRRRRGRSRD